MFPPVLEDAASARTEYHLGSLFEAPSRSGKVDQVGVVLSPPVAVTLVAPEL